MDNWFTDVKLVEELAGKGLSTRGTLKKKKKLKFQMLSKKFAVVKYRQVCLDFDVTLLSFHMFPNDENT